MSSRESQGIDALFDNAIPMSDPAAVDMPEDERHEQFDRSVGDYQPTNRIPRGVLTTSSLDPVRPELRNEQYDLLEVDETKPEAELPDFEWPKPGLISGSTEIESGRWDYTIDLAEPDRATKKYVTVIGDDSETFDPVINPREQVSENEHENYDCSAATPPVGYVSSAGLITRQGLPDGTPVWVDIFDEGDPNADPVVPPIYMIRGLIGADNPACAWCPDEGEPE